jgi:hypothetical protein
LFGSSVGLTEAVELVKVELEEAKLDDEVADNDKLEAMDELEVSTEKTTVANSRLKRAASWMRGTNSMLPRTTTMIEMSSIH